MTNCFTHTVTEKLVDVSLEDVANAIQAATAWANFGLQEGMSLRDVVGVVVMQASTSDTAVYASMLLMQCYPVGGVL